MSEVWHYMDLVQAHKLYNNLEGRYKFYDTYMEARTPNAWLNSPDVPLKDGLLLFGWVHSWDPNYEGDLIKFLEIHADIFPALKNFEHRTIADISLTTDAINSLCIIFDRIANCCRGRRFESTDTSKILHAMIPELFVMWDDKIKKGVIGIRNSAREYDGRCYANEYLPKMQKFAKRILSSYVAENGGDYKNAYMQVTQMFDGITLAKLIDELNYLRFTKQRTQSEIRGVQL